MERNDQDRRRLLAEALRRGGSARLEQFQARLELDENTLSGENHIPLLRKSGPHLMFVKLPYEDADGTWRYGLFDPKRCDVVGGRLRPQEPPFLSSAKGWVRSRGKTSPDRGDRRAPLP